MPVCSDIIASPRLSRFGSLDYLRLSETGVVQLLRSRGAVVPEGAITRGTPKGATGLWFLAGARGDAIRNGMQLFDVLVFMDAEGSLYGLEAAVYRLCDALPTAPTTTPALDTATPRHRSTTRPDPTSPAPPPAPVRTGASSGMGLLVLGGAAIAGLWLFTGGAGAGRGALRGMRSRRRRRRR